ncbi:hypothetical protein F4212_12325 [Candidatus Poribacteria bacterium]|nr:hypothetical protein [Candidatus Poribacteria bacterium]
MGKKLSKQQQKLQDWLTHPDTPKDAWKTMTDDQISEATGISQGYINRILIKVVAQTDGIAFSEAKQQRRTARAGNLGTRTPTETIEEMNRLLREKSRDEVAHILNLSYSTVARHDKTRKKQKRKQQTK